MKRWKRCNALVVVTVLATLLFDASAWAGARRRSGGGGLPTCERALESCRGDLAMCTADRVVFPGDGAGNGPPLSYTDNGDGTITDDNLKLMWGQKVPGGDVDTCLSEPHGVFSRCDWTQATEAWLALLNDRCHDDISVDCSANGDADCTGVCGYAGYRDWRLPHQKELHSLVDYSIAFPGPTVAPELLPTAPTSYWSITSYADVPSQGWLVEYGSGGTSGRVGKTFRARVRPVRSIDPKIGFESVALAGAHRAGGLPACEADLEACQEDLSLCIADRVVFPGDGAGNGPALSNTDNGDGTITDDNSKLTWEQKVAGGSFATCLDEPHAVNSLCTWTQATGAWLDVLNDRCHDDVSVDCSANGDADCAGVGGICGYASYRDWRLPNVKELHSIVDFSIAFAGPSVAPELLPSGSGDYWSPASHALDPNFAWTTSYVLGHVRPLDKLQAIRVRAVRGGH